MSSEFDPFGSALFAEDTCDRRIWEYIPARGHHPRPAQETCCLVRSASSNRQATRRARHASLDPCHARIDVPHPPRGARRRRDRHPHRRLRRGVRLVPVPRERRRDPTREVAPTRDARRLLGWPQGIQRRVHRPRAEPHVRAVHRGHERPQRLTHGRVQRRRDRHFARLGNLRHGGGGATVRARREGTRRPQRVLLLPLDRHLRPNPDRVRGCRPQGHARHHGHRRITFTRQTTPDRHHRRGDQKRKTQSRIRAARRDVHRGHVPRRSSQGDSRRRALRRRRLRTRLHRVRHLLGRHESARHRRRHHGAAERMERPRVRR